MSGEAGAAKLKSLASHACQEQDDWAVPLDPSLSISRGPEEAFGFCSHSSPQLSAVPMLRVGLYNVTPWLYAFEWKATRR